MEVKRSIHEFLFANLCQIIRFFERKWIKQNIVTAVGSEPTDGRQLSERKPRRHQPSND